MLHHIWRKAVFVLILIRNHPKSGIYAFLALIVSKFTLFRIVIRWAWWWWWRWISSMLFLSFFLFFFFAFRSMSILPLFWLSFWLGTSFFISVSIGRRFTTALRSFSSRVFFQSFFHFGWNLFAPSSLVIIWPHKTGEDFIYWLNFTLILWWQR